MPMQDGTPTPIEIRLHKPSRRLAVTFDDGRRFEFSCEFLRVYSPSAEVRGHGAGQEVLQVGKHDVEITAVDAVGNYAVRLHFSDGHNTGIYSWQYLHDLGLNQESLWPEYLAQLRQAGYPRPGTEEETGA